MGRAITLSLEGLAETVEMLRRVGESSKDEFAAAIYQEAEAVMAKSKTLVPVDTGTLRASGHVQKPRKSGRQVSVELGYGGPAARYALDVHENPRAGQTHGKSPSGRPYKTWSKVGQWKYLEQPFVEASRGMLRRIADRVQRAIAARKGRR